MQPKDLYNDIILGKAGWYELKARRKTSIMDNRETAGGMMPPNSVEAEISVLGAMLQANSAVLQAVEQLTPDDFYQPEHREIYQAMTEMNRQQMPIDLVTLQAEMARRGTLDGVGGTVYLMKLLSEVPTAANVGAYIHRPSRVDCPVPRHEGARHHRQRCVEGLCHDRLAYRLYRCP